jgi:hypothetical protein
LLFAHQSADPDLEKNLEAIRDTILQMVEDPDRRKELELPVLLYSYASREVLPGYSTLDYGHIRDLNDVLQAITSYIGDRSLERPLNFLLLASPGSGKSHLINCLANYLGKNIGRVLFNMATMQSKDDLGPVLDQARNVSIDGKLPLVFLDEFDSNDAHYPLLLPLLWDGQLDVGRGDLRLGRSVFFLAGSRSTLPGKLAAARNMVAARADAADDTKLEDVFSRINGTVISLPSLADADKDRVPEKIVVAMELLRRRFKACTSVPWALLRFIARAQFRYEARSIAALINQIPVEGSDKLAALTREHLVKLPLKPRERLKTSPLALHLVDGAGPRGLSTLWEQSLTIKASQRLRYEPPLPTRTAEWIFEIRNIFLKAKETEDLAVVDEPSAHPADPTPESGFTSASEES